mgnify:CR=1 FL=1
MLADFFDQRFDRAEDIGANRLVRVADVFRHQWQQDFFLRAIELKDEAKRGDPHWLAIQFMKSQKVDTIAAGHLLKTFSDVLEEDIESIETPTLILCGSEDRDNGDPEKLETLLPNGKHAVIPGTHMSSVTKAELGQQMVRFLTE